MDNNEHPPGGFGAIMDAFFDAAREEPLDQRKPVYRSSTAKPRRARRTKAEIADLDDAIVRAVRAESPVTLRGVFYRVSSAGAVPKTENGYRAVGRRLTTLRREGRVGYHEIADGTRYVFRPRTQRGVESMLRNSASSYRRMLWENQPVQVQLFTEKDAIRGAIGPVTDDWDVPLGVLRGYVSETFAYEAAESIAASPVPVVIYNLGDHDPSGVDAWRDFRDKVGAFVLEMDPFAEVEFERLAVTPGQIADLELPTRPTKQKDTRARGFEGESVEVDAIPAPVLRRIVEDAITRHVDQHELELTRMAEANERDLLTKMVGEWETISDLLVD
jgi:hypothetical protein